MRIDIRLSAIPKVGYMYCVVKEVSIWCRGLEMALLQEIRRLRALLEEREIAAAVRAAEMQARMDQQNEAAQREMQAIDRMELLLDPMHLMRLAADGLCCCLMSKQTPAYGRFTGQLSVCQHGTCGMLASLLKQEGLLEESVAP